MNRFKLMRYERGLTLGEVAEQSGIPKRTLRSIENGETLTPSAPTARQLADCYGVTVAELLGLTEQAA